MKKINKRKYLTILIMFIICVIPAFYYKFDKNYIIFIWCPLVLFIIIKGINLSDTIIDSMNIKKSSKVSLEPMELNDKIDAGYYDDEIIDKLKKIRVDYDYFNN